MGDQPAARPLPTQDSTNIGKHGQTSITRVGFEHTVPMFELAKTFYALDRTATVIGLVAKLNS
jgi:hypothetical protein